MSTMEIVEILHFDKDGDGVLSTYEQQQRDLILSAAQQAIDQGAVPEEISLELLGDLFLAQVLDHNFARQNERMMKAGKRPLGRRSMFV